MSLFQKGPQTDPDNWCVRIDRKDVYAPNFDTVLRWLRERQIRADAGIFDPEARIWLTLPELVERVTSHIVLTTTPSLEGYRIARYLGIESAEVVIGTGLISEFTGDVADLFGARSGAFETKLEAAKRGTLDRLRFLAFQKGGNAVVGVDLDYTEFSGNRIGVIANGTIVEVVADAAQSAGPRDV